jgi:hypothetical protein
VGAVLFVWDCDGLVSNALLILFLIVLAGIATVVSVVFSLRSFSIGLVSLGPIRFSRSSCLVKTFGIGLRRACRMLATAAPTAARRPLSRGIP